MDVHDRNPKQSAGMDFGTDLRYIRGVLASAQTANKCGQTGAFTQDDINKIKEICDGAEKRAKEKYEAVKRKIDTNVAASEIGCGAETEHRQYTGK
jgi:hypothetical protein